MNSAGSSSFWLQGRKSGWRTEIDVFEIGGKSKGFEQKLNITVHVWQTPSMGMVYYLTTIGKCHKCRGKPI